MVENKDFNEDIMHIMADTTGNKNDYDVKNDLSRRLKKIEGQVKGIHRMISEDKNCVDILTQVAAVKAAVNKVGTIIFENHAKQCLKKSLESGSENALEDITDLLVKFIK